MCPGTVSSSSTTSDTRGVYHVTKLLMHEESTGL
jgi:hypothetical protein